MIKIFLRIHGINGESRDDRHRDCIEVSEVSWGIDTVGGHRAQFADLAVVKVLDSASPRLALACAKGETYERASLEFVRCQEDQTTPYFVVVLNHVIIYGIAMDAQVSSESPTAPIAWREKVTLHFEKIAWECKQTLPNGRLGPSVKTGWSITHDQAM